VLLDKSPLPDGAGLTAANPPFNDCEQLSDQCSVDFQTLEPLCGPRQEFIKQQFPERIFGVIEPLNFAVQTPASRSIEVLASVER
jgi:hypothetical protein